MLNKYLRGLLIFDDAKHRIGAHVLFWLGYYLYRLYRYIDVYEWTPLVQLLELPVKILVVYINIYVLMPFLLSKKKTAFYLLALCFLLVAGGVLQTQMIHLMIRLDIYSLPVSRLYTGYKLVAIVGHIIDLLVFTTVIKILKDAYLNQQKNHAREKENLRNEMRFLRAQINPHFLFNTLNNLYALVLTKSDQAPDILLRITELMSYTLYETNHEEVPLEKELLSLGHYIELEKLRFGDEMNVIFSMEGTVEKYQIAPLLLLPFVENSFKHARPDSQQFSWIHIKGKMERDQWFFQVSNSKNDNLEQAPSGKLLAAQKHGGIGLSNVRRRLEILYPRAYHLDTVETPESYTVTLTLTLRPLPQPPQPIARYENELFGGR